MRQRVTPRLASYRKLADGRLGVRVVGIVSPGDTVMVVDRNGKEHSEKIERVLSSRNGVYICEIAAKPPESGALHGGELRGA
jgi:DNA helicase HerA-like ATPase